MNIKKLFSVAAVVTFVGSTFLNGLALAATPDTELGKAYEWAHSKGITTMDTYEAANMDKPITRAQMAKMLSVYAMTELGMKPDTSAKCEFDDIANITGDLHEYIITSCQLGLMGQGITSFRPNANISRAEFGTALSRTLWGGKYEGGTPYYANHLQALQSAGIMKIIANAETTQEIRGYVMLMLMRSAEGSETKADCEDPMIKAACLIDDDSCPAECKDNASDEKEDTVVKSGDLAVTAKAAEGKKALIGGTSDLDTITFKTSEDVTISSITLERYGYSTKEQVKTVQLEDEDGNIIADAKEINNKGQVKLNLKKDYKTVDGTFKVTIVLNAEDLKDTAAGNGTSIGFKVIDADSTAKNLNLDNYDPYLYDLVNYKGSAVEFSDRNSDKTYNWEAGKLYEIAKFRVKAPADANILVKGFTLTDTKKNKIEADKYAKDVTVTFDGKEVSGLKWNINKDDELVVSFDEVEIEGKKTASIAVNMSFNEEFDNFGEENGVVNYEIKQLSNFNATDKKTGTRISESADKPLSDVYFATYTFKWGKVKISGSKLWTINAAANSTNVKIAEWEITTPEALKWTARMVVKENNFIDGIRLVIAGEEYDGTSVKASVYDPDKGAKKGAFIKEAAASTHYYLVTADVAKDTTFVDVIADSADEVAAVYDFKGLEIEKSGKVEVRVDLKDKAEGTMKFAGSLNSASFDLQYEESREVVGSQMAGSINVSDVKAQAAKASLENKNTKEVELIKGETNRKVIFDGTYEAKKGAITLKNFTIKEINGWALNAAFATPTFYVTVDGEEYDADWSATDKNAKWDIDDIEVADGKSINVKVEIEVVPTDEYAGHTFNIKLEWEDVDNNPAGQADDDTVKVKVVEKGSLNVNSSAKNTVLLKSDRTLAEFTIKPSKSGDEDVTLDNLIFTLTDGEDPIDQTKANPVIKVVVDGDTIDPDGDNYTYKPEVRVPAEWVTVKVSLKSEASGQRVLTLTDVNTNDNKLTRKFQKYYLPAILKVTQEKKGDVTKYNVDVERDDSSTVVSKLVFYTDKSGTEACAPTGEGSATLASLDNCVAAASTNDELSDTDNSMQGTNGESAKSITVIAYQIDGKYVIIKKSVYEDYFKVNGGDYLMLFSNK